MEWLYLIIGIAVLAVLTLAGFVVARRPGRRGTGADVIAPPPPVDAVDAPPEVAVPVDEAVDEHAGEPAAPVLERPEGTASRLVRLRQRLAG